MHSNAVLALYEIWQIKFVGYAGFECKYLV